MFKEIKRKKKIKRAKEMAASALIGGAVTGATVALLTPKSGKELREDIKDTTSKCVDKAKEVLDENKEKITEKTDKIKEEVKEQKKKAKEKTAEVLKNTAGKLEEPEEEDKK